ncbi:conserved hypothetical protein [Histoplasma capsulatum var. duboisii H88]|uniref:Uncharacterized protein n=1 Tax=Ajellomyces capsulatus (strain H88) TaxID=544711 RepID=F0UQH5_AJEC8|nr:conserved hypothetical protein [Histoplasma capsulatum var. duboisii H88]
MVWSFPLLLSFCIVSGSCALAQERNLLPRQIDVDPRLTCKTCTECFGSGYVICSSIGCFNPERGQQCCADAVICVAKDNSCCDDFGGPGVTGTADGTPLPTSLYTPSHTPTGTPFSFECHRGESGEKCCAKSRGLIYCPASGEFPNIRCYHPTAEICCSDGTVCSGEGCCDLVNASPITPTATIPGTGGVAVTETKVTQTTQGTSTSIPASTPTTSNVAAMNNVVEGIAAAAIGILGLVAWL